SSGASIVTVHVDQDRVSEAESILTRSGGDIDRDFYRDSMAMDTGASLDTGVRDRSTNMTDRSLDVDRDRDLVGSRATQGRNINLLSEVLRVNKHRVESGEVRLRKEVRTENQSIEVPVTHEELVIERVPAQDQSATGEQIGTNEEIRVPLSEEQVDVEKSNVVREQVRVGKKEVQDTRTVSEEVRHEDLKVDDETKKRMDVDTDKPKRRKIA
ncbi:MAG TPA: YsnF/AvaK domain-containing protein, partial [Clostridia bacterium]|nr:YsnF/AvaK domain-containing protein [Clostridia bacterium]